MPNLKDDEVDFSKLKAFFWSDSEKWFSEKFCLICWLYCCAGGVIQLPIKNFYIKLIVLVIQILCLILGLINWKKFGNVFGKRNW